MIAMTRTLAGLILLFLWTAVPPHAQAQPAPSPTPVPTATMSRSALEEEVSHLRAIVLGGAVRSQRPAGCAAPGHRQLDFWLGEWDVSPTGSSVVIAESSITSRDQECVIAENWRSFRGAHGDSLSMYDAADGLWHQTYADSTGTRREYKGAADPGGVMRLEIQSPDTVRRRMNIRRLDRDAARQWGESFDPASSKWTVTWDLTYRRRGVSPSIATPAAPAVALDTMAGHWTIFDTSGAAIGSSTITVQMPDAMILEERRIDKEDGQLLWFERSERSGGWVQLFLGPDGIREFLPLSLPGAWPLVLGSHVRLGDGAEVDFRMTLTRSTADSSRRILEISRDGGTTWSRVFDYSYRRAASPAPS
jgi:hypothetical protein